MMIGNMPAGQVSITFNLQGPTSCVVTACATGTNSVGDAFKVIQRGDADVMLAGGTEACISPAPVAGFCAMKALSTNNENPEKLPVHLIKVVMALLWVKVPVLLF